MSKSNGASLVFGVIGAVIGTYAGGNTALGFSIGSSLGGALFPDALPDQAGPQTSDLSVGGSSYGAPIPIIYGTLRIATNMIWADPAGKKETENTENTGSKGTPSQESTTYTYSITAAFAICEGEISGIRRIWINNKLIYSYANDAGGGTLFASANMARNIYIHNGSETQEPSSLQESFQGAGNVPAYRGMAYIEFQDLQLAQFGNGTVNVEVEVVKVTSPDTPPNLIATIASGYGPRGGRIDNGVFHSWTYTTSTPSTSFVAMHDLVYDYDGNLITDDEWLIATENPARTTKFYECPQDNRHIFSTMTGFPVNNTIYNHKDYGRIGAVIAPAVCGSGIVEWIGGSTQLDVCKIGNYMFFAMDGPTGFEDGIGRYPIDPITGVMQLTPDLGVRMSEIGITAGKTSQAICPDDDGLHLWVSTNESSSLNVLVRLDLDLKVVNTWTGTALGVYPFYGNALFMMHQKSDGLTWGLSVHATAPSFLRLAYFDHTTSNSACTYFASINMGAHSSIDVTSLGNGLAYWEGKIYTIDDLISQATQPLDDIVIDLCGRCGIASGSVDATALSAINVKGYAIGRQMNSRAAIEPLQKAYFFDMPLIGNELVSVLRGGASVATIASDDMAAHEFGSDPGDIISITRGGEKELPKRVVVKYLEQGADYQLNEQHADRITTTSENIFTVDLPLVLSADEAAQIADTTLHAAYTERERVSYTLGPEHIALTPADIVTVTDSAIRTRITELSVKAFGPLQINGVVDYASAYTSTRTGISHTAGGTSIALNGPTGMYLLNIPLLRQADDGGGFYVAATGYLSGWSGGTLYKSTDGGITYSANGTITTQSIIGTATNALGDAPLDSTVWDDVNTLTVRTINGQSLTTDSEINVLNGSNAAVLGYDGAWEVIQWTTAVDNGNGTFTLSHLLRGRLGTEYSGHQIGDTFVKLTTTGARFLPTEDAERGSARMYKAVSIGSLLQDTDGFSFTYDGETLTPLSPVHIIGTRDGSNNLTITWKRRSRYNYNGNYGLPLGEATEEYQVDIYDTSATPVFLRTVSTNPTSETASYTAAEQSFDGATPGDSFNVKIYQISATVGNGHPGEALV